VTAQHRVVRGDELTDNQALDPVTQQVDMAYDLVSRRQGVLGEKPSVMDM
jgi:hypothetical protein